MANSTVSADLPILPRSLSSCHAESPNAFYMTFRVFSDIQYPCQGGMFWKINRDLPLPLAVLLLTFLFFQLHMKLKLIDQFKSRLLGGN